MLTSCVVRQLLQNGKGGAAWKDVSLSNCLSDASLRENLQSSSVSVVCVHSVGGEHLGSG